MAKKSLRERLLDKRKELSTRGGGTFKFFSVPEGTTRFRHLPVPEETEPLVEVVYFFLNKDLGGFISPKTWGGKCAVYEAWEELKSSKDEDDKKFAKRFSPKKRYLGPTIRFKDEDGTEVDDQSGVKLLILTGGQYQDLLDLYLDKEAGDFTDALEGYDIKHKRTGKGQFDTEYSLVPCRPTKVPKKFRGPFNAEEMAKELSPSYEETKAMLETFLNIAPEEDEDEAPKKKKSTTGAVKKKKKRSSDI